MFIVTYLWCFLCWNTLFMEIHPHGLFSTCQCKNWFTLYLIFVYNYLQLADKVQMRDAVRQSEDVHIEQVGQRWRSSCENVHVYMTTRICTKDYKLVKIFCNFYQEKKLINTKWTDMNIPFTCSYTCYIYLVD